MSISNSQFVGWTAIAGGIVGVVGFISLALLFMAGEPFGTINDILSIPTAFLMVPVILALYRLNSASQPAAMVATTAGLTGFFAVAIGSLLLVAGRIDFEQSLLPGIGGFGLVGLWVLVSSILGLANGTLPRGVAWTGVLLGIAPTLALLAVFRADSVAGGLSAMGGQSSAGFSLSPLVTAFIALAALSYAALPIWFIWLGRLFTSSRLAAQVGAILAS